MMKFQYILTATASSFLVVQALNNSICTSLTSCYAYGRVQCNRTTQECPPCIYLDSKGKYQCYARVTGTLLCPFVNTTADCSGTNETQIPNILDKNTTTTSEKRSPSVTSPVDDSSQLSSLSITLIAIASVLFVAVIALTVVLLRRKQRESQYSVDYVDDKFNPPRALAANNIYAQPQLGPPQLPFPIDTGDCLLTLNRIQTPVMGDSTRNLSTCFLMESASPVWRLSETSNIM